MIIYSGMFVSGYPEIYGVYVGTEIPTDANPNITWRKITKEEFYDFKWQYHSESYFENQELSSLWKSLNSTAHRNMEAGSEALEGWMDFYEQLFVYHEQDAILYPYELTIAYRDAMFNTTSYMDDRQIEVFNDKLIFGKYLETKTGHSNLLSKFYDLFNPEGVAQLDARLTVFDASKYPSLNPK